MLPTFVIGLREGLEASLIVSIVATFLRQRGRSDLLRWVFAGIATAVVLCAAVGIALKVLSQNLPQRQQEGLETVIGIVAVAMVTYMVVWMRRHSRGLKQQLEGAASDALAAGSGIALVLMAFLAVLREGFETAVFLLAAFNESDSGASAGLGAALGILLAVVLGYAIYRGGIRLNLSKFFRATGLVLVLVAAGLVVNAAHTAHEAGWLNVGQSQFADLTTFVRPGSVQSSLLTGILGIQERPVVIEFLCWLAYLVPVGLYVGWPPGKTLSRRLTLRSTAAAAIVLAALAITFMLVTPAAPSRGSTSTFGFASARVGSIAGADATINSTIREPLAKSDPDTSIAAVQARRIRTEWHGGLMTTVFSASLASQTGAARPSTLTIAQVAALNGGRLPLGATEGSAAGGAVPVSYSDTVTTTWWVETRTRRVVDVNWAESLTTTATLSIGKTVLGEPQKVTSGPTAAQQRAISQAIQHDLSTLDRRGEFRSLAIGTGVGALAVGLCWLIVFRRTPPAKQPQEPVRELIRS
jgi:high-affinity iron transporter